MFDAAGGTDYRFSEATLQEMCQVFRMMADESRLHIVLQLASSGELSVTEICGRVGQSQPAVSHHLKLLLEAGMVRQRPEGKHNFYSLQFDRLRRLMSLLMHEKGCDVPCDSFLECVLCN